MPLNDSIQSAHPSFPLAHPALQRASLQPDFQYPRISLARKLNAQLGKSQQPVFSPGEFSVIGLMGNIYLAIIQRYLDTQLEDLASLDDYLLSSLDLSQVQAALREAIDSFPTALTYADPDQKSSYGFDKPGAEGLRHGYYFSLLLILVAESNTAIRSRDGIFTDPQLRNSSSFKELLRALAEFFADQPAFIPGGASLVDFLLLPGRLFPDSIFDQLIYIRNHWSDLLDPDLFRSLLLNLDRLREEIIPGPLSSKGSLNPLGYVAEDDLSDLDLVAYSPDRDWMPQVILQAKNIYVWLDQLSGEYKRSITTLGQIPEDELIKLARRGINALWLIGLWERSPASQKIKQLCGNPEAESSAYSLFDYVIANRVGGYPGYQQLSSAASKYNIRLAADMVPNHVGIDSRWIIDHPDWFLSLNHAPFPDYSYNGIDLSSDPSVSIFLEDHYYDKTDAAVVFKRVDNNTGASRYIYHGNDGTSMPWNDTAQLDFLNPEVREAVIQTVLEVARKFPIIRFDAAMTLTKKHYQRLWFPQPGTGGAIPTRTDFSLDKSQFNTRMPEEFWREVVDRVAAEVPDTLLLAEAFWMMEGYFVRTLGMHRVYNSAFMHMLRDEDNQKYRDLIIKTIAFDPQILKRYVNFMNNPDEETAISQFGSDGKYFGTCLLMATLPGLPMFGHGQIEGFSEKYGMEYRKAYYDEQPNQSLIERHHKEIAPLLKRRYLFAEVDHFNLYDLVTDQNVTNQDVFAFSNRSGNERALIIYHNKWGDTRGWISRSVSINGTTNTLLEGLGFPINHGEYLVFKDQVSGLEYIRSLDELAENGLFLELGAYQYHAFIDFRIENDQDGSWSALEDHLQGKGTHQLSKLKINLKYQPLFEHFPSLVSPWEAALNQIGKQTKPAKSLPKDNVIRDITAPGASYFKTASDLYPELSVDRKNSFRAYQDKIPAMIEFLSMPIAESFWPDLLAFLPWFLLQNIYPLLDEEARDIAIKAACKSIESLLVKSKSNLDIGDDLDKNSHFLFILAAHLSSSDKWDPADLVDLWFSHPDNRQYINLHTFEGKSWFHKESMETLLNLTFGFLFISISYKKLSGSPKPKAQIRKYTDLYQAACKALEESRYQVEPFIRAFTDLSSEV